MGKVLWNAEHLNLTIGQQVLFDDAEVSIGADERVALVGRNGCGKSTLMKIIAGVESASSGEITMARDLRCAYMPQEFDHGRDVTVGEIVSEGLQWYYELQKQYETLSQNAPEHAQIEHLLNLHDGWNPENKQAVISEKLNLPPADKMVSKLSGGELRRVMLARTVVSEPDLLLLDEPTNHLDVETIAWIEEYLAHYKGACFLVTHDRYFLDRIATRIVELDHGKMYSVEGSYADFLEAKADREYREDVQEAKRNAFLRREVEWVRRSPKARLKRNLGRIKRYYEIAGESGPERTGDVELVIPPPVRLGNQVVTIKNASLSLGGKTLFRNFNYEFTASHKVGIVGANGLGKTSLLRLITGSLTPESGEVKTADTVQFNYVDQKRVALNPENTVYEEIAGNSDSIQLGAERISVRAYLKRFLFEDERINTQIKYLSGGERARIVLAKILRGGGNFLILDEPTNDLDLASLRVLEEALIRYESALIVVSHDRYFLNRVCNHMIAFERGNPELQETVGDFDYYLEKKRVREAAAAEAEERKEKAVKESACPVAVAAKPRTGQKKLSYKDERELAQMDDVIAQAEEKVSALETEFADPALFAERPKEVPRIQRELEAAKQELERLYARWEELAARKEELERG